MVRGNRMYYEQVYIETLWQEYIIPPDEETGDFKIDPNHLHIWPKGDYMFIAIPSAVGVPYYVRGERLLTPCRTNHLLARCSWNSRDSTRLETAKITY